MQVSDLCGGRCFHLVRMDVLRLFLSADESGESVRFVNKRSASQGRNRVHNRPLAGREEYWQVLYLPVSQAGSSF